MKILEQLRKWAWLALAVVAVVSIFLVVRNIRLAGAYAEAKATFEKELKASMAEIAQLIGEKDAWMQKANVAFAAADKAASEKKAIEQAITRKDAENEDLKRKIAVMPAGEVVAETRRRLSTQEIQETGLGIQFSLVAARNNLKRLVDADYFTLVKEPDYKCLLQKNQEEIDALRLTIANQGNAIIALDKVSLEYQRLTVSYADILKKSEKQAKWLKFTIGGAGVAVGVAGLYLLFVK